MQRHTAELHSLGPNPSCLTARSGSEVLSSCLLPHPTHFQKAKLAQFSPGTEKGQTGDAVPQGGASVLEGPSQAQVSCLPSDPAICPSLIRPILRPAGQAVTRWPVSQQSSAPRSHVRTCSSGGPLRRDARVKLPSRGHEGNQIHFSFRVSERWGGALCGVDWPW